MRDCTDRIATTEVRVQRARTDPLLFLPCYLQKKTGRNVGTTPTFYEKFTCYLSNVPTGLLLSLFLASGAAPTGPDVQRQESLIWRNLSPLGPWRRTAVHGNGCQSWPRIY